jgi:8-oxo-dGTP pyrophosphatase MutT (NUDIX family)
MDKTNQEEKTLLPTKYFDVVDKSGWIGIKPHHLNVVVFPYILGETGLPEEVVLVKEKNPLRSNGEHISLVTGDAEGKDPDILSSAQRELKEETGFDVTDPNRWTYLGILTTSKLVEQEQPSFAVDVTGITRTEAKGDGSGMEDEMKVLIMPIKEALDLPDVYIPALFIRVFKYVFGIDFKKNTSK